jgi:hypothetical protein
MTAPERRPGQFAALVLDQRDAAAMLGPDRDDAVDELRARGRAAFDMWEGLVQQD